MSMDGIDKKWGVTQVKFKKCSYTWTIKNFSCLSKKIGEEIESPCFWIGNYEETKWCLRLYFRGVNESYKDYLSVYLRRISGAETIDGIFVISILNNKKESFLEEKALCEYNKNYSSCGFAGFVKRDILVDEANNLLENDTLTLQCEIMVYLGIINISSKTEKKLSENCDSDGLNDFKGLLFSERFSDVKLETACGREVSAHKCILSAKSPTFSAMFDHDMIENKLNVVKIPDIDHEVLKELLRFIYTRQVENVENLAGELLAAADKYGVEDLKEVCEEILCNTISVDNVVHILVVADRHSVKHLKNQAINFIKVHIRDVIDTDGFESLAQTCVLKDIIKTIVY